MYSIQSKSAKMLENMTHNHKKNQSVETDSKIIKIMDLVDKVVKTAIRNMLKYLKKKHEQNEEEMKTIFSKTKWNIQRIENFSG